MKHINESIIGRRNSKSGEKELFLVDAYDVCFVYIDQKFKDEEVKPSQERVHILTKEDIKDTIQNCKYKNAGDRERFLKLYQLTGFDKKMIERLKRMLYTDGLDRAIQEYGLTRVDFSYLK